MNDIVGRKLEEVISIGGESVLADGLLCKGLLNDLCDGMYEPERSCLTAVVDFGLADELRSMVFNPQAPPAELILPRLRSRMLSRIPFDPEAAQWAMETWLCAVANSTLPVIGGTEGLKDWAWRKPPAVIRVSKFGWDGTRSIRRAIEQAPPMARILVGPGRYRESLTLYKPVHLVADAPPGRVVIRSGQGPCVHTVAPWIVLRGMTLISKGDGPGGDTPCLDVERGDVLIEDCQVRSRSRIGINLGADTSNLIIRRTKARSRGHGIICNSGGHVLVEDCDVGPCDRSGVVIRDQARPEIRRCRIQGSKDSGISFLPGSGGRVDKSEMVSNGLGLEIGDGARPDVTDCLIDSNRGLGLEVHPGAGGSVTDCRIQTNRHGNIQMAPGAETIIDSHPLMAKRSIETGGER